MTSKPPTAFIAAGLVLLAMPLLVAFGIGALVLAAGVPADDPRFSGVLVAGLVVWVLLVVAIVAVFLAKLLRAPRS